MKVCERGRYHNCQQKKGIGKMYLFCINGILKGEGLDLREGPHAFHR